MQNTLHFKKSHTGVTLIEMLVVMTIMAILLAIGVPNMTEFFRPNRLAAATNELVAAVNLAKSEAIRRGAPVTLERQGSTNGVWDGGWQVVAGTEVIRVSSSVAPLTVRSRSAANSISFDSRGSTNAAALFVICSDNSLANSRVVIINATGRVRVVNDGSMASLDDSGMGLQSCTNPAAT